jgi:hypothetical protein
LTSLYAHFWWGEGGHHGDFLDDTLWRMEMDLLELGERVHAYIEAQEIMGFPYEAWERQR